MSISLEGIPLFLHFAFAKTSIPLFVMLSGALLLGRVESYKEFYTKRLKRVLTPWIFWTVIFMFWQSKAFTLQNFSQTLQSFWFLPMIFSLYIITPFVRMFVSKAKIIDILLIVLLWFVAISLFPYHNTSNAFPLYVDNGLVNQTVNFIGYFLLGHVLINLKILENRYYLTSIMGILGGFVWVMFFIFLKGGLSSQSLYFFEYISPGIVMLSCGIFMMLYGLLTKYEIRFEKARSKIKIVGESVLGIYFIHEIVRQIINKIVIFPQNTLLYMYVNIFIVFGASLLLIILLRRIPIIGKIVC